MANGAEGAPLGAAYYQRKYGNKNPFPPFNVSNRTPRQTMQPASGTQKPFSLSTSAGGRPMAGLTSSQPQYAVSAGSPIGNRPWGAGLGGTEAWAGNQSMYGPSVAAGIAQKYNAVPGFRDNPPAVPSTADKLASARRVAARRAGPQDTRTPYQAQRGPVYGPQPYSPSTYVAGLESVFRDLGKAVPKKDAVKLADKKIADLGKGGAPPGLRDPWFGPLDIPWGASPPPPPGGRGGLNPGRIRFVDGGWGGGSLPDPKWSQAALANQQKALGLLQSGRAGFSQNPMYGQMEGMIQSILSGQMQPYGAAQQGADYGAISDMLAKSMGAQLGAAEGALAGANLRGGAAPSTSMMLQSQRGDQLAGARRAIGREAARQNFAALQQATQAGADLAGRRAAAEQPYNIEEARMMMNIGLPATGTPSQKQPFRLIGPWSPA